MHNFALKLRRTMQKILLSITFTICGLICTAQSIDRRIADPVYNRDGIAVVSGYNATLQDSIIPFAEVYSRALLDIRLSLLASDYGCNLGVKSPPRFGKNRFKLIDFSHTVYPRRLAAPVSSRHNIPTFRLIPVKPSFLEYTGIVTMSIANGLLNENAPSAPDM